MNGDEARMVDTCAARTTVRAAARTRRSPPTNSLMTSSGGWGTLGSLQQFLGDHGATTRHGRSVSGFTEEGG